MKVKLKITPDQLLILFNLGILDKHPIQMSGKSAKKFAKYLRDKQ